MHRSVMFPAISEDSLCYVVDCTQTAVMGCVLSNCTYMSGNESRNNDLRVIVLSKP